MTLFPFLFFFNLSRHPMDIISGRWSRDQKPYVYELDIMAESITSDAISILLANPLPYFSLELPVIIVQILDLKQSYKFIQYYKLHYAKRHPAFGDSPYQA